MAEVKHDTKEIARRVDSNMTRYEGNGTDSWRRLLY
jgi:hypothetical protein